MSIDNQDVATYIRASTEEQVDDHQRSSIKDEIESRGWEWNDSDQYVDVGSGAKRDREQFQSLLESIERGDYDYVVCWEVSRLSRDGETLQRFFNLCEDTETTVIVTDGAVEEVRPDGHGRFVADIIGMVYQQERRTLIKRTKSGVKRAEDAGKWLGQTPMGFERNTEGYLRPIVDVDEDEVSFIEAQRTMERIENGESYRSVAEGLPVSRQALSSIHQDEDRLSWYIDGDAEDERVQRAIDVVDPAELA